MATMDTPAESNMSTASGVTAVSMDQAMKNRRANAAGSRYPGIDAERYADGLIYPALNPTFMIDGSSKIFTIGSCFARNIEAQLKGRNVPTSHFNLPEGEILHNLGNRILNEYNPGTMAQRIRYAAEKKSFGEMALTEEKPDLFGDLLLSGGVPLPKARVLERRGEIDALYQHLVSSDVLIVTLGLVEAWYDKVNKLYLNRMPGPAVVRDKVLSQQYELHVIDPDTAFTLMADALDTAFSAGLKNVLLTVSPVPLQTTFTHQDVVIANSYSKSVLRTVAARLDAAFPQLDYFPSYEMVISYSNNPFIEDNVHVKPDVVARVTGHMMSKYDRDRAAVA